MCEYATCSPDRASPFRRGALAHVWNPTVFESHSIGHLLSKGTSPKTSMAMENHHV